MLGTKDFGKLEKVFRSLHLTKRLTFGEDEDGNAVLTINFPYSDIQDVVPIDTFYFWGEELESYQAFADALMERAKEYDPIECLFHIVDVRISRDGDKRMKACLRCDLAFVDTVQDLLYELADIAQDVANSNGDISDFVLE